VGSLTSGIRRFNRGLVRVDCVPVLDPLAALPACERSARYPRTWPGPRCDLLAAGVIALPAGSAYAFDNRRRDEDAAVVQVSLDGEGRFDDGGRWRALRPGDAFAVALPSATGYAAHPGRAWRFAYLYLGGELGLALVRALAARRGHVFALPPGDPARAAIADVIRLLRGASRDDEAAVCSALYAALLQLQPRAPIGPPAAMAAARACAEQRHSDAGLDVAQLARAAGCSRWHLARRFAETFGIGPAAYVLELRLRTAQRLLAASDAPLAEVARGAGFGDPLHFAHAFRRHVGMPPGAFRRQLRSR